MRKLIIIALAFCLVSCRNTVNNPADRDTLYQVSLLQSLMLGDFDGSVSLRQLKENGDFGLGTFQGAAGEMVVLDGIVYRCKEDGTVVRPEDGTLTPFSNVTYLDSDLNVHINHICSIEDFQDKVLACIAGGGMNANCIYAVKASGRFDKVTARSIPAQSKPYPTLEQVVAKDQQVFDFDDVEGFLIGFYFPSYCSSFNTTGWHFHFLSSDGTRGGHVLDISASSEGLDVDIDLTDKIEICLPSGSDAFGGFDFSADLRESIRTVESNK